MSNRVFFIVTRVNRVKLCWFLFKWRLKYLDSTWLFTSSVWSNVLAYCSISSVRLRINSSWWSGWWIFQFRLALINLECILSWLILDILLAKSGRWHRHIIWAWTISWWLAGEWLCFRFGFNKSICSSCKFVYLSIATPVLFFSNNVCNFFFRFLF